MKISAYHKANGDDVSLLMNYDSVGDFDTVYISKVFTDTCVPGEPDDKSDKKCDTIAEYYADNTFLKQSNIRYGGTGFFYDKAPPLPDNIEHIMPDYHLYDRWIEECIQNGAPPKEFVYYTDYSIGYLTRGCFRGCYYCVKRNCKRSVCASPLNEFLDDTRKKICLLDDNFFSFPNWRTLIAPVVESGKPFQFKQGLDIRLLNEEKTIEMSKWRYDGDMIFAFDNIDDKPSIVSKLRMIRNTIPSWRKRLKFYVFCGCDKNGVYDESFWRKDIADLFERILIISKFGALPYVMRFEEVYQSQYSGFYAAVASWCNQPNIFETFTFRLYCQCKGMGSKYKQYRRDVESYVREGNKKGKIWRELDKVTQQFPDIAESYFDFDGKTQIKH